MEIKELYSLIDRIEDSGFVEADIEFDNVKLSLKKTSSGVKVEAPKKESAPKVHQEVAPKKEESKKEQPAAVAEGTSVKAPLLGTFYVAPSPDEKPFVSVGQSVKKGDVIGIIEAMKLMNEITSTVDGVVVSVDAENATLVEYGQSLVTIKEAE